MFELSSLLAHGYRDFINTNVEVVTSGYPLKTFPHSLDRTLALLIWPFHLAQMGSKPSALRQIEEEEKDEVEHEMTNEVLRPTYSRHATYGYEGAREYPSGSPYGIRPTSPTFSEHLLECEAGGCS